MNTPYITEAASTVEYDIAHADQVAAYDADDLLAELCEIGGPLMTAVRVKDGALIGRLVLAVVAAQIERRACIVCGQESAGVYAELAAAEVMRAHAMEMRNTLAIAHGRHKARRFTGAPLSTFGSI